MGDYSGCLDRFLRFIDNGFCSFAWPDAAHPLDSSNDDVVARHREHLCGHGGASKPGILSELISERTSLSLLDKRITSSYSKVINSVLRFFPPPP